MLLQLLLLANLGFFLLAHGTGDHNNEAVILSSYPDGEMTLSNFEIVPTSLPEAADLARDEIILELQGLSVDPYMRGRMRHEGIENYFVGAYEKGKPIAGGGLGKVVASKNENFAVGDYLTGTLPWERYIKINPSTAGLAKAPKVDEVSFYYKFLFPFNIAPLSAWLPIRQLWPKEQVKAGSVAYVSGAAGAVGMIAGQILKNVYGCYVIGSAGSDEKVKFLKDVLGFDEAFNYKTESPYVALPRLAPNKINYFFDNVGGETLDAALLSMAFGGKIIACGSIGQYDKADTSVRMKNLFQIIVLALKIEGYLVFQFQDYFGVGNEELLGWAKEGKLITHETYVDGLENAPAAFIGLFKGDNVGKMMVRVVQEEKIASSDEL